MTPFAEQVTAGRHAGEILEGVRVTAVFAEALVVASTTEDGALTALTALQPFGPDASLPGTSLPDPTGAPEGTLLGRLLGQLHSLGITRITVLTRAGHRGEVEAELLRVGLRAPLRVVESPNLAGDLDAAARVLAGPDGGSRAGLLVLAGDVALHREALATLVADPRVTCGALTTSVPPAARHAFGMRSQRGRVVSTGSVFHAVTRPTSYVLDVFTVGGPAREDLAARAAQLADLVRRPPEAWRAERRRKTEAWRQEPDTDPGRAATRISVAEQDAVALLLVGLVRSGATVVNRYLRRLFWARPIGPDDLAAAAAGLAAVNEDDALLAAAVKANDGFFTTHFVSPYSRYVARWAARHGWSPNQVTTVSLVVGLVAALAFATGGRAGLVAGAVLLQVAFVLDCVDGQLARYTRRFSSFGAWLDSVFDRGKEYAVFAGLAIGAARSGDDVWWLAAAALALQTVRHLLDFSYHAALRAAAGPPPVLPLDRASDHASEGGDGPDRRDGHDPRPPGRARIGTAAARVGTVDAGTVGGGVIGGDTVGGGTATSTMVRPAVAPGASSAARSDDLAAVLDESRPDWLAAGESGRPSRRSARRSVRQRARGAVRLWHRLGRPRATMWIKRILLLPIGERFALISLLAAFGTPRLTFQVLLVWGTFALVYGLGGRALRSLAM